MTETEKAIAAKLCTARFPSSSASKRFARDLGDGYIKALSPKGRKFMAFVAHRFRRQYRLSNDEQEWVNHWKDIELKDFFTKTTVEASCWCQQCRKDTVHQVHGGRPGACLDCLKRLENPPLPGIIEPEPEQIEMFRRRDPA